MSTATQQRPPAVRARRRRRGIHRWGPPVLFIAPTIVILAVFVYGLIASNIRLSMTDQNSLAQAVGNRPTHFVGLDGYAALWADENFQHALRNLGLYTAAFLAGTLVFGFLWAFLLERGVRGEGLFRSVYLFPMAVSMVAAGVVWRWLLNTNVTGQVSGLNQLFDSLGLGFLKNHWWDNPDWGILAIAMPAIWQLSGYVMALFLAGFRGIPDELREAARMDGASEWQLYRHVVFPQLSPVALSAVIIVGHMSLKVFDLVVSIVPSTKNFSVQVPATMMANLFSSGRYALSAAVGTVLLLLVAVLIVPYLVHSHRAEKR